MHSRLSMSAKLALPLVFVSHAAFADVSPAQVWGDWRDYMQSFGYSVSGTEAKSGSTLTINDVAFSLAMPETDGQFAMTMQSLTFTQNGDGTVSVTMPEVMPINMNFTGDGPAAKPVEMQFTYRQSAPVMTVSGSAQELSYVYNAATAGLTLDQLKVGPDSFGDANAKVSMLMTGISTTSTTTIGNLRGYQQSGKIDSVQYDFFVAPPDEPNVVSLKGGRSGLTFEGTGALPMGLADATDMSKMMAAGFDVSGKFAFGPGNQDMQVSDPVNGNFSAQTTSDGGDFSVDMASDGLGYGGSQNNLAITANVNGLPFPITLNMAKAAFNLAMPVTKSDMPQDFAFGFTMADFTMADMLWGLFDPQGKLPRDPATLDIDLTGKAKLLFDIMDPEAAAQMTGQPGELQAVTVNRLKLDAVGAEVTGTGDFAFDNSDMTTYPGMPKPVGAADLAISGANGLIDNLIAMGILPEQQAMGARMMMGLFTIPGAEPDSMTSKIEFTQDGQILANGQRIK